MPGVFRTHSLVCENKKHTSKVTTGTPNIPAFPARMVLTVSFALSLETGLVVSIAREIASQACCQHRDIRTTRLRRPRNALSSVARVASIASRTQRP
jgi:hypothetical protein